MFLKIAVGLLLFVLLWIASGWLLLAAAGPFSPSGRFVDIGDRKLRLVCAGPKSERPVVWMEAGAYGLAADFAAVQAKLAARGVRSCAYDRAGMGWSDPAPGLRDSEAIARDLDRLMTASGERAPFILVGHSMAGLHIRLFAARHADRVAGLVLVEAATPEQTNNLRIGAFVDRFRDLSRVIAVVNTLGLSRPFYLKGDRIGLPPQGRAEKRRAFVSGRHARTAAAEIADWRLSAAEGSAAAPYDPRWPVAVVVAGERLGPTWTEARRVPERASGAGLFISEPRASHNTILGEAWGDAVVRGVEHVLESLPTPRLESVTGRARPSSDAGAE